MRRSVLNGLQKKPASGLAGCGSGNGCGDHLASGLSVGAAGVMSLGRGAGISAAAEDGAACGAGRSHGRVGTRAIAAEAAMPAAVKRVVCE